MWGMKMKKEPWEMTRIEYAIFKGFDPDYLPVDSLPDNEAKLYPITREVDLEHKKLIKKALADGKSVPRHILKDYGLDK